MTTDTRGRSSDKLQSPFSVKPLEEASARSWIVLEGLDAFVPEMDAHGDVGHHVIEVLRRIDNPAEAFPWHGVESCWRQSERGQPELRRRRRKSRRPRRAPWHCPDVDTAAP